MLGGFYPLHIYLSSFFILILSTLTFKTDNSYIITKKQTQIIIMSQVKVKNIFSLKERTLPKYQKELQLIIRQT